MHLTVDEFIAGWIGGVCGLVVGHPLDTIKVRQQNFGSSMMKAINRTYFYEGIRGFYKGLLFPLLTVGPSNAVFFGIYGNCMKMMQHTTRQSHTISAHDPQAIKRVFIAGSVAGFFQVLCTCPVELIKTVLQSRTEGKGRWRKHYEVPYTGPFQALKGVVQKRGVRGLYRGALPMLIRDVPTSGLYVLTYEFLLYSTFADISTPLLVKQMVAGGCAGIMSWMLVIPLDVIKSRIQADNPFDPQYKGMIDCFRQSYKEGGLSIFAKGLPAIIIRAFPTNASIFVGYEVALEIFSRLDPARFFKSQKKKE